MLFSADWYPTDATTGWKLQGAEVILDDPVLPKIQEFKNNTGAYLSMHAPMLVAIGSKKPGVRFMSTETIVKHLTIMRQIQPGVTNRIVVHAANYSERTPEEVWEVQRKTLWSLWYKMRDAGLLDSSLICLENLGKLSLQNIQEFLVSLLCSKNLVCVFRRSRNGLRPGSCPLCKPE